MATSSVNLLGQVITVTATVPADPTSNKNIGPLQAVLWQFYGLNYLGGQFAAGQITLQLQDQNNPPLSALAVVGAVSDALAASIGDPGADIQASLPTSNAFGGILPSGIVTSGKGDLPIGSGLPAGGSITGSPGGNNSNVGGFGSSIMAALNGAWNAILSAIKALFSALLSDFQTGAIVLLVAVAIIAVLIVAAKS